MRSTRAIGSGAVVTAVVGVLGSLVPVVGTLAGPLAGGMLTGVRSVDDRRLLNGFVATSVGGTPPAYVVVVLLGSLETVDGVSATVPSALALAAVLGVVGALSARFLTGSVATHPAMRDGT